MVRKDFWRINETCGLARHLIYMVSRWFPQKSCGYKIYNYKIIIYIITIPILERINGYLKTRLIAVCILL